MKRQSPSIFNDIVGPIMVGPSSSHTCAPSRIGYLCQQLLKGNLTKAVVEFAKEGAYTNMYKGQHSDMGYINGLLGNRPEDPKLRDAFKLMKKAGIEITFEISDFSPTVPNLSKVTVYSDCGEKTTVYADSTGGGTIKLLSIEGFEVAITGDCYELLIKTTLTGDDIQIFCEQCHKQWPENEGVTFSEKNDQSMINIKKRKPFDSATIKQFEEMENVIEVSTLTPILIVTSNRNAEMPFASGKELLEKAETEGRELWEYAIEYEKVRSGWTEEEILNYMVFVVETMEAGVKEALTGKIQMNGIIEPTAGKIDTFMKNDQHKLDMGILNTAVPWAMATMEYSSASGVVLCAPTGGSAGIFPGAVLGTANAMGLSMEDKVKLMLTTSIVGIVMSKDHNYSAELYGCQVEPGAASAMAAGALVYLMGGTVKQSFMAASCAIQNILGTICDPVAGLVQVPCISRNAMSVANAVVSANMVMGGYDPLIPLDQAAETMFRVGMQLPSELRCTCNGGLCTTACGMQLAKEQEDRDNKRQ